MNSIVQVSKCATSVQGSRTGPVQWLLIYCTCGESCVTVSGNPSLLCQEGQLVVIPPATEYSAMATENYSDISIFMEQASFHCIAPIILTDHPQRHLQALFEQAYCYSSPDPSTYLLLDSIGDAIANHILIIGRSNRFSSPVEQLWILISQHYDSVHFALDESIRQLPFNYDYVRKRFKQETGLSPLEYLTELRMRKAKSLLASIESCYITDIAHQCGYDDPLYFSRVFRKYNGISPKSFSAQYHSTLKRLF